ncbi:MAG: Gfo/Idh/MocA family oxidoreductase [Lachnospiraceae bacterium]|nr:Gfo/Idh/MocA family oxidoreductase [Lachnospiraceae bacterium]
MLSYLIVGSGYRSEYFGRIATRYPELFRAMFLCRSEEKVLRVTAHTGIPGTTSLQEAEGFLPDFVVVAVDRGHMAQVIEEWVLKGYPVVSETPVGSTMAELERLWELQEQEGARIVCCEQYPRHPILLAGEKAIRGGRLGTPTSGYLSLMHDYHAFALLRQMMLTDGEEYTLTGSRTGTPVVETDSRYGAFYDGRTTTEVRDVVQITFSSGKTALYDFSPVEYRSYIRSRHLTVRCERGEWNDRMLYYVDENGVPGKEMLLASIPEAYRVLDTQALRDIRRTWEPELQLDTQQDEFAIASLLLDMEGYLAGGASPYPLRMALEDALFWILLQEAVAAPGTVVRSPGVPWR